LNKQSNLNTFLDVSAGSGTHAPRQRQAYASKRLQQVISDFRKAQKSGAVTPSSPSGSTAVQGDDQNGGSGGEEEERPTKKQKKKLSASRALRSRAPATASRNRARARAKGKARGANSRKFTPPSDKDLGMSGEDDEEDAFVPTAADAVLVCDVQHEFTLRPRPKPRPKQNAQADAWPLSISIDSTSNAPE
jgi:DNA excision repair protein ERCC-5